ncbi:MAG: DUF1289 domain-containing protein [Pseudomonadota bacterium]
MESPCILVCTIDDASGFCHGCGRTRDEIGAWTMYSDTQRADIMASLDDRIQQIEKKPRRITKRQDMVARHQAVGDGS